MPRAIERSKKRHARTAKNFPAHHSKLNNEFRGKVIRESENDYSFMSTVNVQSCASSKTILPIGLPRFDVYRSLKKNGGAGKNSSKKQVLYAGFSLAHSEKRVVDALADHLDTNYGPGVVAVHYRPHPLGVPRIDDYEIKNPHVVVTDHGDLLRTGLPHMDDDFINALTGADVVVGAPTTLMLEAMLVLNKLVFQRDL